MNCYLRRKLMNRIEENALDGFEFYFHKTKIKKELEKIKLEQVPCNLNDTSIPSKSENENLRSQKNEGGQKSNVSSSNNNISTVNNTSKEPIKIIPKITEQLKKIQFSKRKTSFFVKLMVIFICILFMLLEMIRPI